MIDALPCCLLGVHVDYFGLAGIVNILAEQTLWELFPVSGCMVIFIKKQLLYLFLTVYTKLMHFQLL